MFEYTYSAARQNEIRQIREKYLFREITKLEQLRALDKSVTKRGTAISLVWGILYSLVLGLGMSCCLVWKETLLIPGIVIGCLGIVGMASTYSIYHHIVRKDQNRIAPKILRLSEELIHSAK